MAQHDGGVSYELVVSYPKMAVIGSKYLMTIDLEVLAGEFRYDENGKCELDCIVSSPCFSIRQLGASALVVRPPGRTDGALKYELQPRFAEKSGRLTVLLVNRSGIPVLRHVFADICISIEETGSPGVAMQEKSCV